MSDRRRQRLLAEARRAGLTVKRGEDSAQIDARLTQKYKAEEAAQDDLARRQDEAAARRRARRGGTR